MPGTVIAFDFGERRIGVAVGELSLRSTHPLETIAGATNAHRFERIGKLIDEWHPERLVIGLPAPDDDAHPLHQRCRRFARQLEGRFGIPAELVDEGWSSAAAEIDLTGSGLDAQARKAVVDQVAAQAILQTWYEHHSA